MITILTQLFKRPKETKRSCPFCGSDMKICKSYTTPAGHPYRLVCSGGMRCPITPSTGCCLTEEDALAVWDNCTKGHDKKIDRLKESQREAIQLNDNVFEYLRLNHNKVYEDLMDYFYQETKEDYRR
jgi:hypothetical protein